MSHRRNVSTVIRTGGRIEKPTGGEEQANREENAASADCDARKEQSVERNDRDQGPHGDQGQEDQRSPAKGSFGCFSPPLCCCITRPWICFSARISFQ